MAMGKTDSSLANNSPQGKTKRLRRGQCAKSRKMIKKADAHPQNSWPHSYNKMYAQRPGGCILKFFYLWITTVTADSLQVLIPAADAYTEVVGNFA